MLHGQQNIILKTMFCNSVRPRHQARPQTLTGIPFPLCGRNCSILQSFQTSPIAHSASCSCAKGYFSSEARGIPFSVEIRMREALHTLRHTYFGLMLYSPGDTCIVFPTACGFSYGNISVSYFLTISHCTQDYITSVLFSRRRTSPVAIRRGGLPHFDCTDEIWMTSKRMDLGFLYWTVYLASGQ
jgi:hypothetical protein